MIYDIEILEYWDIEVSYLEYKVSQDMLNGLNLTVTLPKTPENSSPDLPTGEIKMSVQLHLTIIILVEIMYIQASSVQTWVLT